MKKEILDRYGRTGDGRIIIDITADKVEYLFNNFDKRSPFIKKELDPDLVDYLIDSLREIGNEKFVIYIHLKKKPAKVARERINSGIQNYFSYLEKLEYRELGSMARTSLILLIIGGIALYFSIWLGMKNQVRMEILPRMITEGLTVASWVSLWEALATFMINWTPHSRMIKICRRISAASVEFRTLR